MKKALLLLTAFFIFAGCVSTKTFQAALDESDIRGHQIEKMKIEMDALRAANERLTEEVARLKGVIEEMKGENANLDEILRGKNKELSQDKTKIQSLTRMTGELSTAKEKEVSDVKSTYENLVKELKGEIAKGDIKITQAMDKLSVNLVEKILFDSGKSEVKPEGKKVLKRVGDILKKVTEKEIRVEGHTDDVPIGPRLQKKFPTNWELSTARATEVVRFLQDTSGVDPKLLSAVGYSKNRPVAGNDTEKGRTSNRRIEIVLLPLNIDRVLQELKK